MYCIKCGHQIEDGAKFCPYCGVSQQAAAPLPADAVQPPVSSYQQPYAACQPESGQPYAQPAYQQAVSPMYAQPPAGGLAPQKRQISKAGFIISVILSAAAMGIYILTMIGDVGDLIDGYQYVWIYFDLAYFFLGFVPLFVFCLCIRKLSPMILGFTFAVTILYRLIGVFSSVTHVTVFGVDYSYDVIPMICVFTLTAGIVLYIISMALPRDILVLKIISAVLLGATAVYHIYDFITADIFYWFYEDPLYVFGWIGYAFSMACGLAALIVVLFTCKMKR